MTKLAIVFPLLVACVTSPATSDTTQAVGCDGQASYVDENGEEVICVYTEEPYDPPDDPWPGDPGDPFAEHCALFPELCVEDPPPPTDLSGGGEPTDDYTHCGTAGTDQQAQYDRAMRKAQCVIQTGGCSLSLATAESESPRQVLSDLDVREHFLLNCVAKPNSIATTYGRGQGADAIIRLRPPFYGRETWRQVVTLLHELGHATGRMAGHGPYYDTDPTTSQGWNDKIYADCLAASIDRCGDPVTW